jgi:ABC-type amino acid transport substrate-binding protein
MKTVTLAYDDPFPPLAFNDKGEARGVVIDILSEAMARVGMEVRFIPSPMERVKHLLVAREADAIAFYAITREREALFDFSDPVIMSGAALFVRSPQPAPRHLSECAGKRVATPATGPLAQWIGSRAPEIELCLVADYQEALTAVLEGKADAAALNIHVGRDLIGRFFSGEVSLPSESFFEVPLAVATLKGTGALLLRRISEGLLRLKQEGAFADIIARWDRVVR